MKKLLLLGGSRYLIPVIQQAKKLGVYTITCDYLPNNISHKFSDEYHNISIVEVEKVLSLAKDLKVDGIMSFACDPGVVPAAFVASKLGLPVPGPYESVCILQNKGKFRSFLRDNGFNVPFSKSFSEIDEAINEAYLFPYPIIVKPTDSAGSKGVSRVDSFAELRDAICYALSFSRAKEFIVEEFIESEGFSSDSDCFSVNGELIFSSFSSQRFDSCSVNPYTPAAYSWPSSMPETAIKELTGELQRLLFLLHMRTAIYNVETRLGKNGKAYIMEVSPRAGGNRLAEMLHYATGTDLITKAIFAALGEPVSSDGFQSSFNGHWAEIILHGDKAGAFDDVKTDERLTPYLIESDLWITKGQMIRPFSAANEAIGTLILRFDQRHELEHVMSNISDYIQVRVRQ